MQITQNADAERLELCLVGRLDATWADHVSNTIQNAVRGGSHRIVLNMAGVHYISSLGISVLVSQYRLLKSVNGSLSISEASTACRTVLKTVGLTELFRGDAAGGLEASVLKAAQSVARGGASYEIYPQTATRPMDCTLSGHPERLGASGFTPADLQPLSFPAGSFGLGIGAFGEGFDDCAARFGEFMAAGGCAIALPTGEQHARPDYVVAQGDLIPRVETLYALSGRGDFSTMVRFDALPGGSGKIGLTELAGALIEFSGARAIAFAVLAETAGLVGAALRRSPAMEPAALSLPGVRDWISFTTERAAERRLGLLVGVAGLEFPARAEPFLRRMKEGSPISAHIHAALFPYRPVQRGELPFAQTIAATLAASTPDTVLHLMADTRPFEGVGETDLVRGACWMGAIGELAEA